MKYTVKQLARIAGVSVRTLHYYDEIGVLKPSFIKENGYRCYEEKELLKLQQILFFRELEFPLVDIIQMVNAPDFNIAEALADQRKLLELKKLRINKLLKTIEITMKNLKGGENMTNDDLFGSFTQDQIEEYKKEAKARWGNTEAYKQSIERTKNWTKEDYKRVEEQGKALTKALADAMDKGSESPDVQALIAQHYRGIQQFYDLSYEMYRNLGNMYVADARFTAYYDTVKPGLAQFVRDAIAYYADEHEKGM